jgi:homogentisate 1,2-dioxygenase
MLNYQSGFGNEFSSEAVSGALPLDQNSPQRAPKGLYAEQLSGSAFTAPRHQNKRTWLYRIRPSVCHKAFDKIQHKGLLTAPDPNKNTSPNQLRWDPLPSPPKETDFISGLVTFATNGSAETRSGSAVHLYVANTPMTDTFFYNADGELLIVPQEGTLLIHTELGTLEVAPHEIALIPRGIKFQVAFSGKEVRGYVCENYGTPFELPQLGPIGANGLAHPRHFLAPTATYHDQDDPFQLLTKFQGTLWASEIAHNPLDVVAWHGNYVPYKYDLKKFQTINTVSFDHPDPSIFTVLTSPSHTTGTANCDFVIFPPRWMVAENTFRPPYYHRNIMSEFMGLISGEYDAKTSGFVPGGSSLHNCMSAHGPEAAVFEKASEMNLKPQAFKNTMAFMFESNLVFHPTQHALTCDQLQKNYMECWKDLKKYFKS